jgi:hypothetical protein
MKNVIILGCLLSIGCGVAADDAPVTVCATERGDFACPGFATLRDSPGRTEQDVCERMPCAPGERCLVVAGDVVAYGVCRLPSSASTGGRR